MDYYKEFDRLFKEIKEKHPNIVIITATQPKQEHVDFPMRREHLGPDLVIVDYINLLKTTKP